MDNRRTERVIDLNDTNNITATQYNPDNKKTYVTKRVGDKEYSLTFDGKGNTIVILQYKETIEQLAQKFNCTVEDIKNLNDGIIYFSTGDSVIIPGDDYEADDVRLKGRGTRTEELEKQRRADAANERMRRGQELCYQKFTVEVSGLFIDNYADMSWRGDHKDTLELKDARSCVLWLYRDEIHNTLEFNGDEYSANGIMRRRTDEDGNYIIYDADNPYVISGIELDARVHDFIKMNSQYFNPDGSLKNPNIPIHQLRFKAHVTEEYSKFLVNQKKCEAAEFTRDVDQLAARDNAKGLFQRDTLGEMSHYLEWIDSPQRLELFNKEFKDRQYVNKNEEGYNEIESHLWFKFKHSTKFRTCIKQLYDQGAYGTGEAADKHIAYIAYMEIKYCVRGATYQKDVKDSVEIIRTPNQRRYVDEYIKNDSSLNANSLKEYLEQDGWNKEEVSNMLAPLIGNKTYVGEKSETEQNEFNNIIRNGLDPNSARMDTILSILENINDDPNSEDFKELIKSCEQWVKQGKRQETIGYSCGNGTLKTYYSKVEPQFKGQDIIQTYFYAVAGRDIDRIKALNHALYKNGEPPRVTAEIAAYQIKKGNYDAAFQSRNPKVKEELEKIIQSGGIPGFKSLKEIYNLALNKIPPLCYDERYQLQGTALLNRVITMNNDELVNFCYDLLKQIDKNKGLATGAAGGKKSNLAKDQELMLQEIISMYPDIALQLKTKIENNKNAFQYTAGQLSYYASEGFNYGQSNSTSTVYTANKYIQLINNTFVISDKSVFIFDNQRFEKGSQEYDIILQHNKLIANNAKQSIYQSARNANISLDGEGNVDRIINSCITSFGSDSDRSDVERSIRKADYMLRLLDAAAEGRLRNSEGKIVSLEEFAKELAEVATEIENKISSHQETLGTVKQYATMIATIAATILTGGTASALGAGAGTTLVASAAVGGLTEYGINYVNMKTSGRGYDREQANEYLKRAVVTGSSILLGGAAAQYAHSTIMAANPFIGKLELVGKCLASDIGIGMGAEYILTGQVTIEGILYNAAFSVAGNIIHMVPVRKNPVSTNTHNIPKEPSVYEKFLSSKPGGKYSDTSFKILCDEIQAKVNNGEMTPDLQAQLYRRAKELESLPGGKEQAAEINNLIDTTELPLRDNPYLKDNLEPERPLTGSEAGEKAGARTPREADPQSAQDINDIHRNVEDIDREIPAEVRQEWNEVKKDIENIINHFQEKLESLAGYTENTIKKLEAIFNKVSGNIKNTISNLIDKIKTFIIKVDPANSYKDKVKTLSKITNKDGSPKFTTAEINKLLESIPKDININTNNLCSLINLEGITVDEAINILSKVNSQDRLNLLNKLTDLNTKVPQQDRLNYLEIDNILENLKDNNIPNIDNFIIYILDNGFLNDRINGENVSLSSKLNDLTYYLKTENQCVILENIMRGNSEISYDDFTRILKNNATDINTLKEYDISGEIMQLHERLRTILPEELHSTLAWIDDPYILEYIEQNYPLNYIDYGDVKMLIEAVTNSDGTLYHPRSSFYYGDGNLERFRGFVESQGIDIDRVMEYDIDPLLEGYDNIGLPMDIEMSGRFEHLREYISLSSDPNMSKYVYDKYYLEQLKVLGFDENTINSLKDIDNKYGVKILISSNTSNLTDTLRYISEELDKWTAASNGWANLPPVIDFNSAQCDWYDTTSAYGQGVAGAYSHPRYKGSLSFSKQNKEMVEYAIRHELTHSNDTKRGGNIDPKYNLDEIMPKKTMTRADGSTYQVPDLENCMYIDEFRKIGIPEWHIEYAYNNTQEFIAVASEGDLSKCSPEFKQLLIDFGMPEYIFNIK